MFQKGNLSDRSLCIFSGTNPLRQLCFRIVSSKYFEYGILVIIVTNCVFLAMDTPNNTPKMRNSEIFNRYQKINVKSEFNAINHEGLLKINEF